MSPKHNILSQLYLLCAFLLFLGPLQELTLEMSHVFKSTFLNILQWIASLALDIFKVFGSSTITIFHHVNDRWYDIYAPMLAPIFWLITGYISCTLSRPKEVTTIDIASTYIPRHLRRNTKGMRRKKRRNEKMMKAKKFGRKKMMSGEKIMQNK